jgi:hypothetical protein
MLAALTTAVAAAMTLGAFLVWFEVDGPDTSIEVRGTQRDDSIWLIEFLPAGWIVLVLAVLSAGVRRRNVHHLRSPLLVGSIGAVVALWCFLSWTHFEDTITEVLTKIYGVDGARTVEFSPGLGLWLSAAGGLGLIALSVVSYVMGTMRHEDTTG